MSSPSTTIWPRATAAWMGKIYRFLGLTMGVIVHGLDDDQRQAAYGSDITYGTNNEFGFDYLRDNMNYERGPDGAARSHFRHRRRGGLHPDRRGAHAADHFGPARRPLGPLQDRSTPSSRCWSRTRRLRDGREAALGQLHRSRHREAGKPAAGQAAISLKGDHRPVRRRERRAGPPHQQRPERPQACSPATRTISSGTTRSSSSTSSPAA